MNVLARSVQPHFACSDAPISKSIQSSINSEAEAEHRHDYRQRRTRAVNEEEREQVSGGSMTESLRTLQHSPFNRHEKTKKTLEQ